MSNIVIGKDLLAAHPYLLSPGCQNDLMLLFKLLRPLAEWDAKLIKFSGIIHLDCTKGCNNNHELSKILNADTKKDGEILGFNESCLPSVGVHFNMALEDNNFHWDWMSMFLD